MGIYGLKAYCVIQKKFARFARNFIYSPPPVQKHLLTPLNIMNVLVALHPGPWRVQGYSMFGSLPPSSHAT